MSTFISFRDGETVHILDVCIGSKTLHRYVENRQLYDKEKTAIKRAIMLHRKKLYNSTRKRRKRRKIIHTRKVIQTVVFRPMIITFLEEGKKRHLVAETGKSFKRIKNAIKNALDWHKRHN